MPQNANHYTHKKKKSITILSVDTFPSVGVTGFEPVTPCSQSRCANRTALHPEKLLQSYNIFLNKQIFVIFYS